MKVIDLLNKMNNLDNLPKKIWVDSTEFEYDELERFYQDENEKDLLEHGKVYSTYDFLNFEVTILDEQEENKINIQDIEEMDRKMIHRFDITQKEDIFVDRYNEILKYLKQLNNRIKEIK